MKRLYIALSFLFFLPVLMVGQTATQNWVKTKTYKQPTINSVATPSRDVAAVQVTYYDGLGREVQQLAHKQTPNSKDIIGLIQYDAFGRPEKQFLAYPSAYGEMAFDDNAATNSEQYHKDTYGAANDNPYSQTVYEASPLGRVLKQAAPGASWKVDSDHTIRMAYLLNTNGDQVKMFKATTSWDSSKELYTETLQNASANVYYPASELYKTVVTDENGQPAEEFKDKMGRLVLKRIQANSVVNNVPTSTKHDTYYVYDEFGNLAFVLPPLADSTIGTTVLQDLCYQYRYDYRNRLVEKKLPGKQWEFMVYDKLDRVVATGPSKSPFGSDDTQPGWLVTKYDAYGRPAYTGWYTGDPATAAGRTAVQSLRNLQTANLWETQGTNSTIVNIAVGYTNVAFPTSNYILLTANYYDTYSFPGISSIPTDIEGEPVITSVKSLPTGSWARVLTTTAETLGETFYILYDKKGRQISEKTFNYLGGYTTVDSKLDFLGRPLYTITRHKKQSRGTELYIKDAFTYTDQDQLLTHTHQIGTNGTPQLLSNNEYDATGQLVSKRVGGTDTTAQQYLQKVDYSYNIRGWLKGINDVDALLSPNDTAEDLFAFRINYDTVSNTGTGQTSPLFNGNIAETFWVSGDDGAKRSYSYFYDGMNRLNKSVYHKNNTATHSYDEEVSYDKNGNIKSLFRKGDLDAQSATIEIDELAYTYDSGNRLLKVSDATTHPAGFNDSADATLEFGYDADGNVTSDLNKEIASITYNHLNLPTAILFSGSSTKKINYLYDAAGGKLKKTITTESLAKETDYLSGFQYRSGSLDFFPTAEGYVKTLNAHGTISYNYIFNHTDHLGNVRLSYTDNGSVQIVQQDNYYSFGLKHEKYNVDEYVHVEVEGEDGYDIGLVLLEPGERNPYQYKFGGKEFQDELGLNMYDFSARNYDPALGRWMNIDPLAETSRRFSPYTYALNNPVYFIDPDGMEAEGFNSGDANATGSTGETETASGSTENESEINIRFIHEYTVNRGYGLEVSNRNNVASVNSEHLDIQDPPKKKKKELTFWEEVKKAFKTGGKVVYKSSGSQKFDDDMRTARNEGASIGEAGWQAFVLNKQNEMTLGNGSASPYGRTAKLGSAANGGERLLLSAGKFPRLNFKFGKHAGDWAQWGSISKNAYYNRAIDLASSQIGGHISGFTSKQGWIFRFNRATGEFLTKHPDGNIETFFRPKGGMSYYLKQVEKYGNN